MYNEYQLARQLYSGYLKYKEPGIRKRRITYEEYSFLINKHKNKNLFGIEKAGSSAEGRTIYTITTGEGEQKILLWSQMHGDESTSTAAILDILNFLSANDEFDHFRSRILKHLKIIFIPMLNPDGAENHQRRNINQIDINRDAIKLNSPEARLLLKTFKSINPQWTFNLHDQSNRYTAGNSFRTSAVSLLAPPLDESESINENRTRAMKLCGKLFRILSDFIPGHISRYDNDFEPRAFGELFQKKGAASVLIESGHWIDDTEKQFIRKLNFILLLSAFFCITQESCRKEDLKIYDSIPLNQEKLFDLLLKNISLKTASGNLKTDIGIIREEFFDRLTDEFYYISRIEDVGDLQNYYGLEEYDLNGYLYEPAKIFSGIFNHPKEIRVNEIQNLIRKGNLFIKLRNGESLTDHTSLPVNLLISGRKFDSNVPICRQPANFIITKSGRIKYIVLNGSIFDPAKDDIPVTNALVL